HRHSHSFPTRRSSDLGRNNVISRNGGVSDPGAGQTGQAAPGAPEIDIHHRDGLVNALEQVLDPVVELLAIRRSGTRSAAVVQFRSEEHTSELQSPYDL